MISENLVANPDEMFQLIDSITPISVDIATQVTDIVARVTPAVVGVENIQTRSFNFWDQAV